MIEQLQRYGALARGLRRSSWPPGIWDAVVAVVVVALSLRVLAVADRGLGFRAPDLLTYLLTGVGAAAIGWARRQPLAALLVTGVTATALSLRDDHVDVLPFVVTALLFAVGSYRPRGPALFGLATAAVALAVSAASQPVDLGLTGVIQSYSIFTVAWVLGRLTRAHREALLAQIAAAEQQAATERVLAASERDRVLLSQVEERLRIARELHDVLAHSISVISVQATVGEHLAGSDPPAARRALLTIGEVSRSSMRELRQMLTLLRDDSAPPSSQSVSYEPAHGLDDLDDLVATFRAAGLPVRTAVDGNPRPLTGSTDLCAYRIVQEALTNTLKHAGPSSAQVVLEYGVDALLVSVHDDGRGVADDGGSRTGHGLIGMRERTALLGGELVAGQAPSGGFVVTATIPYEAA